MPHSNISKRARSGARRLRRGQTEAERVLWRGLHQLPEKVHWRRQTPIGPYVADFACLEARIVVEVDGSQHADSAHDRERDRWLAGQGFRILRFWNNDVLRNLTGCLEAVANDLSQHPHVSQRGRSWKAGAVSQMETRIDRRFAALAEEGRPAVVTFISAGDPDYATSLKILQALPKAGADIVELGMPFSDPMAEGPPIQRSSARALRAGQTMIKTLEMVRAFRRGDDATPIVLMGYYNPIYSYGNERFLDDAKAAGVDGLIVVDLPPEADDELCIPALKHGISFIRLATPTTDDKRLPSVLANTSGFVYYVSILGITGTASPDVTKVLAAVERIKRHTHLPVAVGFGVKTGEQVAAIGRAADGVVIGSALVNAIEASLDDKGKATASTVDAVTRLVAELAKGAHLARAGVAG